jgi:predicted porin
MEIYMFRTMAALALTSTAIAAHAQSSVTIYGVVDAGVTTARQGAGTTTPGGSTPVGTARNHTTRLDSSSGPGARIGFRGTEDMGDGLSANFVAEEGVDVSTGALQQGGLAFGRQIWVGLASKSGWSVSAGRQYSPLDLAVAASDPLTGNYWGNALANAGLGLYESVGSPAGGGSYQASARVDNSVLASYRWGGLTARLMWAAGNENSRGTGRLINPGITYETDKLRVDATYTQMKQPVEMMSATAAPQTLKLWHVGGSYNFGFARLYAGVLDFKGPTNRADLSAAFTTSPFTYSWTSSRSTWIGARIPVGPSDNLTVSAMRVGFKYPTSPDGRSLIYGVMFDHSLSKRTALYASYGRTNNDAYAKSNLFSTIVQVAPNGYGADHSAFSVGVRHSF